MRAIFSKIIDGIFSGKKDAPEANPLDLYKGLNNEIVQRESEIRSLHQIFSEKEDNYKELIGNCEDNINKSEDTDFNLTLKKSLQDKLDNFENELLSELKVKRNELTVLEGKRDNIEKGIMEEMSSRNGNHDLTTI